MTNNNGWKNTAHKIKEWTVQHKAEIIGGSIAAVCIGVGVWSCNRTDIVESVIKSTVLKKPPVMKPILKANTISQTVQVVTIPLKSNIADPISETIKTVCEHPRRGGIRNLHFGWNASPAKIAEAAEKGITLEKGQTLVSSCIVGSRCA